MCGSLRDFFFDFGLEAEIYRTAGVDLFFDPCVISRSFVARVRCGCDKPASNFVSQRLDLT